MLGRDIFVELFPDASLIPSTLLVCDFANITSSKSKIYNLLDDEGLRLSNIKTLSDKEYSWNIAAEKYRDIFLGENK